MTFVPDDVLPACIILRLNFIMANGDVLDYGIPGIYINYQMFVPVANTCIYSDETQIGLVNLCQQEYEDDLFNETNEELLENTMSLLTKT